MTIATTDGQTYPDELSMMLETMKQKFDNPSDQERLDDSFKRLHEKDPKGAQSDMQFLGDVGHIGINQEALKTLPESTNIDDRTTPQYQAQEARDVAAARMRKAVQGTDFGKILTGLDSIANPQRVAGSEDKDTTLVNPEYLSPGEYDQLNREKKFQSDLEPFPSYEELQKTKKDFFDRMNHAWANRYAPTIEGGTGEMDWYFQWLDNQKNTAIDELLDKHKKYLEVGPSSKGLEEELFGMSPKQLKERGIGPKSEDDSLPLNAKPTAAETPVPSPYGETYDKFVQHLEKASDFLNPSFIPTAEQFRDAPWKEKLGFIIGTSLMMTGSGRGKIAEPEAFFKEGGANLNKAILENYRKLDNPVAREEYKNMIKSKMDTASEGGETSVTNISQPEIGKGGPGDRGRKGPGKPYDVWTPTEIKAVKDWYLDPNGDLGEIPAILQHRSEGAIFQRLREMGLLESTGKGGKAPLEWSNKELRFLKEYNETGKIPEVLLETKTPQQIQAKHAQMDYYRNLREGQVDWKDPEISAKLKEYVDQGKGPTEIAKEFGVTKNSATGAINRLKGYKRRDNPKGTTAEEFINNYKETSKLATKSQKVNPEWTQEDIDYLKSQGVDTSGMSAKPFVPKGALRAPEKGSGSGGGDEPPRTPTMDKIDALLKQGQKSLKEDLAASDVLNKVTSPEYRRNTELEGKSGISTPNKTPEEVSNENASLNYRARERVAEIMRQEITPGETKLTRADVDALLAKHAPLFEKDFAGNPQARLNSGKDMNEYLDRVQAIKDDMRQLEYDKSSPYEKALIDKEKKYWEDKRRRELIKPLEPDK